MRKRRKRGSHLVAELGSACQLLGSPLREVVHAHPDKLPRIRAHVRMWLWW